MSSDPPEGRSEYPVLERYELLSQIGQGGMGTVYLARHTGLGKIVAVKILPARMMQDAKAVARFEREMKAVGLLDHENIVVATDGGESGSSRFLAMEFVDGLDLARLVGRIGPLRVADACEILRQAAAGLQHAHEHGLLHRDIKPSNLMLTKHGCIKVLDLGLARLHRETAGELSITDSGEIMGTPDYMSPEQATNSTQIDIRADIYALGCSFYNLLTGRAPFGGSRYHTPLKKLMAHVRSQPQPVETQRPDVPLGVRDVLTRMMSKSPADRYATPAELATALEPLCGGADLPAMLKVAETLSDGAAPTESLSQKTKLLKPSSNAGQESPNRRPRRIGLLGVLVVILLVGGWLVAKTLMQPHGPVAESSPDASNFKDESAASAAQGQVGTSTSSTVPSETTPPGWHGWPADAPPPAIAPFDAQQAQQYQEAWAKYLKVPVEYTNSIGMKFRLIPPGEFLMGNTPEELEEFLRKLEEDRTKDAKQLPPDFYKYVQDNINSQAPQHQVIVTQPVYLGLFEVTQAEYQLVMGRNPSHFAATGFGKDQVQGRDTTEYPVEMVSWPDAAEFCAKLSELEQRTPCYSRLRGAEEVTRLDGTGYRLPTEAEWESACRSGTTTKYWCGDQSTQLTSSAWFVGNSGKRPHAVGELKANPFGLFDTHGNVWEWMGEGWELDFFGKFKDKPAINPNAPLSDAALCVIHGGCFLDEAATCAAFVRGPAWHAVSVPPTPRSSVVGFRIALPISVEKPAAKAIGRSTPLLPKSASAQPSTTKPDGKTGWHEWPADAPPPAIAPFGAEQAQRHQEAWAKYLKVPVEYTNSVGMKFRLIPPGEFLMGATQVEVDDALRSLDAASLTPSEKMYFHDKIVSASPQHRVIVTQPFYLGALEITQAKYQLVMGQNPSHYAVTGAGKNEVAGLDTSEHPVEFVSRADAAEFCSKLSQAEKLPPYYLRVRDTEDVKQFDGTGYRLPTEAEWEVACRAGTTTRFWIGNQEEQLKSTAWHRANAGRRTHPVSELQANPFGLFDVQGNVSEWVDDGWDSTSFELYRDKPAINPNTPVTDPALCVIRGNNWSDSGFLCCVWSRAPVLKQHVPRCLTVGFRVLLPVTAIKPLDNAVGQRPASSISPESLAHNREMAQSILRRGGEVSVVAPNEAVRWVTHPQNNNVVWPTPWLKTNQELPKHDFLLCGVQLSAVRDDDIEDLASLSHLQCLSLWKVPITDKGMGLLATLPKLRVLSLIGCNVADAGASQLKRSKSIEHLDLGLIPLSDDVMPALGEMHQLVYLSLHGTLVTDDRLDELQELRALKNLLLGNTNVTATGCARMRQVLPACKVLGK